MIRKKAVFFDRDGIIVKPVNNEAPTTPNQLEIIADIVPVIYYVRKLNYLLIIVSNQPDITLGLINEKTKRELEKKFEGLLKEKGVVIDKIYYCHHYPRGKNSKYVKNCRCRKPKPGMLLKAAKRFNIDLSRSFMVGDRASDIKAGFLAGTKTILFDPGNLQVDYLLKEQVTPDYKIKNLKKIIQIIQ